MEYDIQEISEDCFDVFVSDDDGYTWEYYATYNNRHLAVEEASIACWNANRTGWFDDAC